jgi:hypothetical protein
MALVGLALASQEDEKAFVDAVIGFNLGLVYVSSSPKLCCGL